MNQNRFGLITGVGPVSAHRWPGVSLAEVLPSASRRDDPLSSTIYRARSPTAVDMRSRSAAGWL